MSTMFASLEIVRVLILTSVDGGAASERDVRALIDHPVTLYAAIEVRRGGKCAWITDARTIESRCDLIAAPKELEVAWSKVEAGEKAYDNVPNGRFHLALINWIESPWASGWSVAADVKPIVRRGIPFAAGTMRYRVSVTLPDGRSVASPGLSESPGGPARAADIRKVMIRTGDDYLGMMTELANLPYIFGSTENGKEPHQAERAIGVDCADLVIYGLRMTGHDLSYRSSRTLGPVSQRIAKTDARRDGGTYLDAMGHPIPVGLDGVRPGDWIVFEGHVGAFFEDRGVIGKLDEQDLLMHIAWKELAIESMIDSGYGEYAFDVRRADALTAK